MESVDPASPEGGLCETPRIVLLSNEANRGAARRPRLRGRTVLSQKCKYALRALLVLAREQDQDVLLIGEIAERERLPKKFLEAILLELKRHGIVRSRRGRGGGYALAKPADVITFGQVVRLMDGPLAPTPCVSVNFYQRCTDCRDETQCEIRRVMRQVREAIANTLDHTTLQDALMPGRSDLGGDSGPGEPALVATVRE